jgi:hypothetical protein
VWLSATETEVYAASLLLSWGAVAAADRAGRGSDRRWLVVAAYLLALAVPLHMSALVAAPAAVVLTWRREGGERRWGDAATLGAVSLLAVGVGSVSRGVLAAAALALAGAAALQLRGRRRIVAACVAVALLAFTGLAIMLVRAAHDPAMNAGNPSTLPALADVVARRQYGGHPLWPRQAPLWLQLGNFLQWLDWQFALGLHGGVGPSPLRTPVTVAFCALALLGAAWQRRRDQRGLEAMLALVGASSVGLVLYMNFEAGASYGWPFVPDAARHEARERDYFFALAFWGIGMWGGMGAVALVERVAPRRRAAAVALAALPIALNWRGVDRRGPDAALPRAWASALLGSAPPRAVLLAGGDNDGFPPWYAQVVEGTRRDVVVVIVPLLGAQWYRAELARRHGLLDEAHVAAWRGEAATLGALARAARAAGRPLASSLARRGRAPLGAVALRGVVWVDSTGAAAAAAPGLPFAVDTATTRAVAARVGGLAAEGDRDAIDPTPRIVRRALACRAAALAAVRGAAPDSLDTRCNFR